MDVPVGVNVTSSLAGWTPYRLESPGMMTPEPIANWCWTEGVEFTEPFFDQTIERCFRDPDRLLFQRETPMSDVDAWAHASPGLRPSGLIFHSSRCGSTLVSRMLASLASTIVLSEAPPIDTAVRADATEDDRIRWLRGLVSALGQPRRPADRHLVLKLDAWAVFDLRLIRRAFPDTPAVFLYRDPVEILASHHRRRGYHMIPGTLDPALLGLEPGDASTLSPDEYMEVVLGCLFAAAARSFGESLLLVDYAELPRAVVETIAPHFGIDLDPGQHRSLSEVAAQDAKNPSIPFVPAALPTQGADTQGPLRALYQELELLRAAPRPRR